MQKAMAFSGLLILGSAVLAGCSSGQNQLELGEGVPLPEPTFETYQEAIRMSGVPGQLSSISTVGGESTVGAIELRVSEDFQTSFLSIEGEIYMLEGNADFPASNEGGFYADGEGRSITFGTTIANAYSAPVIFADDISGIVSFGYVGVETFEQDLPTGTVNFIGSYQFAGGFDGEIFGGSGSTNITVDFSDQEVTGFFESNAGVFGQLDGIVVVNGVSGTLSITDATLSGTMDLDGTFYGPSADQIGGILSGSVNQSGTAEPVDVTGFFNGN